MKFIKQFLEAIVMLAIGLVILFTFVEDLSTYLLWDWNLRRILIFAGFGFDVFFTLEFIVRYTGSIIKDDTWEYLFHKRGWIDFAASFPLLLFNSGPSVYLLLSGSVFVGGAGILNILKVVKAVRVARILRMLRVLKIFRNIKSIDSVMTQRHLARIVSTVVVSIICAMFFGSIFFSLNFISNNSEEISKNTALETAKYIDSRILTEKEEILDFLKIRKDILLIKNKGEAIYIPLTDDMYKTYFGPGDYMSIRHGESEIFFDLRYKNAEDALPGMLLLITIIIIVIVLMLVYSPHFAITISDPVFIMLKGMRDKNYNLEVDIPGRFKNDDIFRLSREYNNKYLTLKARDNNEEGEAESSIKLEDLGDLFE